MSINISLWEDSGPVVNNKGSVREQVTNIGWKDGITSDVTPYVYDRISRPEGGSVFTYSYKKYNFIKFIGTNPGSRLRISIKNTNLNQQPPDDFYGCLGGLKLFYKLTNVYEDPSKEWDGSLIFVPETTLTIYPRTSTLGPENATAYNQYYTANVTYYSEYLVTQLAVENTEIGRYGNIGDITFEITVDEYEVDDL